MATKSIYKLEDERITSDSIVHKTSDNAYENLENILNSKNQVLWEGAQYMNASQKAQLSQKLSEQKHGIVMIFSGYSDGAAKNWNHACYFVPKSFIKFWNGGGIMIPLGGTQGVAASKYIYIYDDRLEGNDNNQSTSSKEYVLSQVIGV